MANGILLLGLGPGDPALLTLQARQILDTCTEVYFRTDHHPVAQAMIGRHGVQSFDTLYQKSDRFEDVYAAITEEILRLGQRAEGVVYAVPGHPFVAEATCPEIYRRAKEAGIPVQVVDGISFIEPVCSTLGLDPFPRLVLADAIEVGQMHHPDFPPDMPVLFTQIYSRPVASELKMTLTAIYPDDHPVRLVHAAGTPDALVEDLALYEIDRSRKIGITTALYVPPMPVGSSFEAFQEIIAHLRAPDGCPWDKEQTHASLRKALLEETYETLAAIDAEDPDKMTEEYGDLLLQIVLNAQIAYENSDFNMSDIVRGIYSKIIRRHPHVFGNEKAESVGNVLVTWEKIKAAERAAKGEAKKSLLDGVPIILPSLTQAHEIQDRAARVGFDWKDEQGVIDKMHEELNELKEASTPEAYEEEMGDLLFAVVNLARWHKLDSESCLRATNDKFRRRFGHIEDYARENGCEVSALSFEKLDDLWNEAKHLGKEG
jgi:tetrapyrrole methylase family protein / MazG family protein